MSASTVSQVWRNGQFAFAANFHAGYAFIPALDHLSLSQGEWKRLTAVLRAVELGAISQPSGVVHLHLLTEVRSSTRANYQVFVLESRRVW